MNHKSIAPYAGRVLKNIRQKGGFTNIEFADGTLVRIPPKAPEKMTSNPRGKRPSVRSIHGFTLQEMVEAGIQVSVQHFRRALLPGADFHFKTAGRAVVVVPAYFRKYRSYRLLATGGHTHLEIRFPATHLGIDDTITTSSVCSDDDSFSYKQGVKNALDNLEPADVACIEQEIRYYRRAVQDELNRLARTPFNGENGRDAIAAEVSQQLHGLMATARPGQQGQPIIVAPHEADEYRPSANRNGGASSTAATVGLQPSVRENAPVSGVD